MVINSGSTLQLNSSNALSSANDVTDNGTLRAALGKATFTIGALSGTGTVNGDTGGVNSLQTLSIGGDNSGGTFSGVLSNDLPNDTTFTDGLAIVKAGTGTETFSGTNSYSGGTIIEAGTLQINLSSALGSGTVTLNDANTGSQNTALLFKLSGGTVPNNLVISNQGTGAATISNSVFSSTLTFSGSLNDNANCNLDSPLGGTLDFTGILSGSADTLNITGYGLVALGGASTFTGSIFIGFLSNLRLDSAAAVSATNDVTDNGTLQLAPGGVTYSVGGAQWLREHQWRFGSAQQFKETVDRRS